MGKIIFGGKQFFLGTTRMTRDWLAPFGITPARFNMMCAIASQPGGVAQHDLRGLLGVTSQTISRMLKSLEQLGYILRKPHRKNPRFKWCTLTPAGNFRLLTSIQEIVNGPDFHWSIAEILNPNPGCFADAVAANRDTDVLFTRARAALGDIATLVFPFDDALDAPRAA